MDMLTKHDKKPEYYEVDLAEYDNYDYTKGDTVMIVVISDAYPDTQMIEDYLKETRFQGLKVCNISEIVEMDDVMPYAASVINLTKIKVA